MTVEEASNKVCPFIQDGVFQFSGSFSIGSIDQLPQNIKCITTKCMAWRFDPKYAELSPSYSGFSHPREPEFLGYSDTEGYCERLSR